MDYQERIINILMLSDFYEKQNFDRGGYLLLEPIIIRLIGDKKNIIRKDLISYISDFILSKDLIIEQILDRFFDLSNLLMYNKKTKCYYLNLSDSKIVNKINEYNNLYLSHKSDMLEFKIFLENNIDQNISIEKDIYEYIYHFFVDSFLYEANTTSNYSNIDKNIANILNECYEKNIKYISIFKKIIQGIAIIKAMQTYKKSNIIMENKPTLYVDNVFISNIFGWCDDMYQENDLLALNILRDEFNFKIAIHEITIDLLLDYVDTAINLPQNKIDITSLFYYIRYPNYLNDNVFNINDYNISDINNAMIERIKEHHKIEIKKGLNYILPEDHKVLYDNVHNFRKNLNLERGNYRDINEKQTVYDVTIINRHSKLDRTKINSLQNMDEIFLTHQRAIINNTIYKPKYNLYNPIMNIKLFINLLLVETIINNIKQSNELLNIIVINYYSKILSSEFVYFINKTINDTNISDKDKKELLSLIVDKDRKNMVIKYGSDHLEILEKIKNDRNDLNEKINLTEKALEEKNKVLEEKNKALEEKDKALEEKDKALKEKDKVLKEKDMIIFRNQLEEEHKQKRIRINNIRKCIKIKNILLIIIPIIIFLILFIIFRSYILNIVSIILSNKFIVRLISYFSYEDYKDIIKNVIGTLIILIISPILGIIPFISKLIFNKIIKKHNKKL